MYSTCTACPLCIRLCSGATDRVMNKTEQLSVFMELCSYWEKYTLSKWVNEQGNVR